MKTFYEMLELMEADDVALGNQDGGASNQDAGDTVDQGQDSADGQEPQDMASQDQAADKSEPKHYMFFSNLKVIKEKVEAMLAMDASQVDAMLDDGHDWASDHISTSKDDVEEVYNWLSSSVGEKADAPVTPEGI